MPLPAKSGGGKAKKAKKPTKKQLKKLEEIRVLEELMQRMTVMKNEYKVKCGFYITEPKEQFARQVDRAIAAKEGLKKLLLSKQKTTQNDARAIADTIKSNPDIQSVHFWHVKTDLKAASVFADCFQHLPSLTQLELVDAEVNSLSATHISHLCKTSPTLQTLIMDHNSGIGAEGLTLIFDGIRDNPSCKIQSLSARYCGAGSQCGESIGLALKRNKSLSNLDLTHNHLGDAGLLPIAYGLGFNSTLKTIFLANNEIIDAPPPLPLPPLPGTQPSVPTTEPCWWIPGSLLFVPPDTTGLNMTNEGGEDGNGVRSEGNDSKLKSAVVSHAILESEEGPEGRSRPIVSQTQPLQATITTLPTQGRPQALPVPLPTPISPLDHLAATLVSPTTGIILVDLRGNHITTRAAKALLVSVKARSKTLAVRVSERVPNDVFAAIQDGNRKVFDTGGKGKGKGKKGAAKKKKK